MKVISNVIKVILTIILTVSIILLGLVIIASSTVLNKQYTLSKLEETNYYGNIYSQANSDFRNYIYQSGLEETVLDNIITQDMVKNDVITIINNIYDGTNKTIDVDALKEKLNTNINNSLQNKKVSITMQKAIDEFVEKIANQYMQTMTHTEYEDTINKAFAKVQKYTDLAKKALSVTVIVTAILVLILNYKKIYKVLSYFGIVLTSSGLFYIITNIVINQKVKIDLITIFNGPISISLRTVLTDILNTVMKYGAIALPIGIVLILLGNFLTQRFHTVQKVK